MVNDIVSGQVERKRDEDFNEDDELIMLNIGANVSISDVISSREDGSGLDEIDEFVLRHTAYITVSNGRVYEGGPLPVSIGAVRFTKYQLTDAYNVGFPFSDLMDSDSVESAEVYDALFCDENWKLHPRVFAALGLEYDEYAPCFDVLHIDWIGLEEQRRGQNIGLRVIERLIGMYASRDCIVVLKARPLHNHKKPDVKLSAKAAKTNGKRLVKYYEKIGFVSVGEEGYMIKATGDLFN